MTARLSGLPAVRRRRLARRRRGYPPRQPGGAPELRRRRLERRANNGGETRTAAERVAGGWRRRRAARRPAGHTAERERSGGPGFHGPGCPDGSAKAERQAEWRGGASGRRRAKRRRVARQSATSVGSELRRRSLGQERGGEEREEPRDREPELRRGRSTKRRRAGCARSLGTLAFPQTAPASSRPSTLSRSLAALSPDAPPLIPATRARRARVTRSFPQLRSAVIPAKAGIQCGLTMACSLASGRGRDASDTLTLAISHKGLTRVGLAIWERGRPARNAALTRGAPSP